jgi:NADH dehydrogenase [ubiquinone] 1 alpha subcomplex assembly factor 6
MSDDRLSACASLVRQHDHDRYLVDLFAPADRREALFALHAFNHEIAKTRHVVTEPMLGRIRLQWWRDCLAGVAQGGPANGHEVLTPLSEAMVRHELSPEHFERLIEAQEREVDGEPIDTPEALEAHADDSCAPLLYLALEILGARGKADRAAARCIGVASGIVGTVRAAPHCTHPPGSAPAEARALTRSLSDRAGALIAEARALRRETDPKARPALMSATIVDHHIRALRRAGYNPADPRLAAPGVGRILRLGAVAALGRY